MLISNRARGEYWSDVDGASLNGPHSGLLEHSGLSNACHEAADIMQSSAGAAHLCDDEGAVVDGGTATPVRLATLENSPAHRQQRHHQQPR